MDRMNFFHEKYTSYGHNISFANSYLKKSDKLHKVH